MNSEKILSILNKIENEVPVYTWKCNKIDVWPIIRNKFGMECSINQMRTGKEGKTKVNYLTIFIRTIFKLQVQNFLSYIKRKEKTADVLFLFSNVDRTMFNDFWVIKQAYPIIKKLEKDKIKVFCLEHVSNGEFKLPKYEISKYIDLNFYRRIVEVIKRNNYDFYLNEYEKFLSILRDNCIDIDTYDINQIKRYIINQLCLKDFYKKTMQRLNAKVAIIIGYYGFAYDLIAACEELKICTIDLQHGIAGQQHYAYGKWNNVPQKGFNTLPKRFYSWSQIDSEAINFWSRNLLKHSAISIGNTWNDYWRDSNDAIIIKTMDEVNNFYLEKKKPFIIFTHQPPFGIPGWLLDFMAKRKDIYWGIRLHPCDENDREIVKNYNHKFNIENINYEETSSFPLPALFAVAEMHITGWSAAIYEAMEFNIENIIIHDKGAEIFSEYLNNSLCTYAATIEDFERKIDALLFKKKKEQVSIKHSEKNCLKAISDIETILEG